MNFLYPIYTEQTECQDCYKCIRHCPVKAILVENGHAMIIPEQCIMCGTCVMNCPAKAKHIRDDLGHTKQLLKAKKQVYVSLAPSFASEFPNYSVEQIIAALRKLGFTNVSETAIGADFVSMQIAEDLEKSVTSEKSKKLFLSSACPAVVEYIKQCKPEFTEYITDRASPLLAHSRFLRSQFGEDIGIVFIGPCIAKKREADVWKTIDVALTFNDLRRWFSSEGIVPEKLTPTDNDVFVPQRAAKGSLYPVDGGMIAACKKYSSLKNLNAMSIAGIGEIEDALLNLHPDQLKSPLFIELLACPGGCINGPGTAHISSSAIKRVRVLDYAKNSKDAMSKEMQEKAPKITDTLPKTDVVLNNHSEEEIRSALKSVGKFSSSDELNCASCGYDTCRAFATAMLDHRAEKTMCVSYMRKLAQKKANSLIKAIPSGVVIANRQLEIVECNYNFALMMGSDIVSMYEAKPGLEGAALDKIADFSRFFADVLALNGPDVIEREIQVGKKIFHVSVFAIEKEEIAGGVIDDITAPEIQKHRIVTQARKVINKHLSTVQKIAFLLGENAAESESILNSIIESFSDSEEDSK